MEPNIHDIFEEYKEMMAGEAELKFNEEASSYLLQMICLQKHIRQRSSDLKYNGQEHFVYEHGIEYRPMERPWDVEKGVNKECFRNATILALRDPSLTYVEGFALSVVLPTLHAWCVTKDGDVIDPTWKTVGSWYIGVPFPEKFVRWMMYKREYYGILDNMEMRFPLLTGKHRYSEAGVQIEKGEFFENQS